MLEQFFESVEKPKRKIIKKPKKPKKEKPECIIYVDAAEHHIFEFIKNKLKEKFGRIKVYNEIIDPKTKKPKKIILEVGDYLLVSPDKSQEIVIERKTVDDLVASMKDGRAKDQMPKLSDCERGYLTIIGDVYDESAWEDTNMSVPDSVTRYTEGLGLKTNSNGNSAKVRVLPDHDQLCVQIDYFCTKMENDEIVRVQDKSHKKSKFGRSEIDFEDPENVKETQLAQLSQIGKINIKRPGALLVRSRRAAQSYL